MKLSYQELRKEARKQHRINYFLTIYSASLSIVVILALVFMYIFS